MYSIDSEFSQVTVQCAVGHRNTKYTELILHSCITNTYAVQQDTLF